RASILPPVFLTAVTQTAYLDPSGATGAHPGPKVETTAQNEEMGEEAPLDAQGTASPKYVASKTGSKYHLPWCGGAKQIKEENKVWFQTKEEAEAAGYEPA